jgi:hypothetical protein
MMTMDLVSRRLQAGRDWRDGRRCVGAKAARGVFVRHRLHFGQSQAMRWHAGIFEQARAKV